MKIFLKENETMQDIVESLVHASKIVDAVAPIAYWYENLNENGRIKDIHFSPHMREMLGYHSVEEFPDDLNTLMTFTHPDDVHIMLENAIAAGTGKIDEYNVEYRIRNASGRYTWCNATGKVVADHKGVTIGMYGSFIDISAKKTIDENAIISSFAQEYDAAFFGNLADRSFKVLTNKNEVAEQISGIVTAGAALKKYVQEFVHPEDAHLFADLLQGETVRKKIEIGQSVDFEYRSNTGGVYQWYRATFSRLNENDVLIGFKNCNSEVNKRLADEKLLGGYDAIYVVNLDRNEIEPIRKSRVTSKGVFEGLVAYDSLLQRFAETVEPKYRQDWLNFSNPDYMKQYMSSEDSREYIYELPEAEKKMRRFTVDVLERRNGEASKLLFSFIGIDDLRAQTILLHRKVAEQASFTNFFLSTYESAYYIGFDDRSCQIYKRTEQLEKDYPVITDYFDSLKKYINEDVHPQDREQLLQLVVPEQMRAILKEKAEYTHIFRDVSYGKEKLFLMQVIRGADEAHAAFGFKDVTDEMKKQNEAQRHIAIEQHNRRIMALEDNLESLYDVNLETGRYSEYVKGDFYKQNVTDKLVREGDFFSDIVENIETVIFPEDQEDVINLLNRENLRRALSKTDRIEHFYRLNVGEKPLWLKMRIVYKDSEKKSLVIGCFNAVEEMAQKQRNDDLVSTFSKQFSAVYYGNLEDGSYQILVRNENVVSIIKGTDTICDAIKVFTEKTVHPDDRHLFRNDFYSLDSILAKIHVGESYVFEYRSDNYGDYRWFRAEFRRTNGAELLVGFRDCNDEVLERLEHEKLQKEMEEQHALSDGLAREYHTVWLVDGFGEHRLHLYRSTGKKTVQRAVQRGLDEPTYDGTMVKYVMDSVHEDDRERVLEASRFETVQRETPDVGTYVVSYKRYCDDKGNVDYHQMCFAKAVADDGTVNYILAFRDADKMLREQMEMQQQLKNALDMAQSANRAKTTFLNNMSHDIRTPMNAIIGYTGLAASHIDNKAQVQDYLAKIGQSSDHLLSLINDVLDMSRIESGKMNLDEKEENLSDIIHTLRDIVQADIHSKQIDFYVDAVEVYDECIVCDKLRLNQVLLNILSNAIKYTSAGGTVTMRVIEKTVKGSGYGTYDFIVKDSGMGMDKEFLDTIFDPFTRVKSSTVSGIQGTGLGMAITKNIIDMMGGRIDITSTPGKGTEVVVSLDFKLKGTPKEVVQIPELKGLRALVVDDDANTCLSISKMIREIGMKEEWCTSGKEAVIRATEAYHIGNLFKVYIIDWMMPDMNGIETTRRIRKVIGDDVPIIVLTAYDWADIEDEAREAGVTEFVSKPMFPSDLHRVLSKCLGDKSDSKEKKDELDLSGKKILLVEDNELNREIATAVLEEYGCVVYPAEDGDVAVEKMKSAKPGDYNLVLMDIQMPTIDGYEATRQIRAIGTEISKIPILAMTANAFEEDREAALAAGMDEHIAKPIDIEKLKETLARFL